LSIFNARLPLTDSGYGNIRFFQPEYVENICFDGFSLTGSLKKSPDTVGELKSAEMSVSHMPSWKAKKLGKLPREKVLLEL
jgi:hypothetical protein